MDEEAGIADAALYLEIGNATLEDLALARAQEEVLATGPDLASDADVATFYDQVASRFGKLRKEAEEEREREGGGKATLGPGGIEHLLVIMYESMPYMIENFPVILDKVRYAFGRLAAAPTAIRTTKSEHDRRSVAIREVRK